MSHIISLGWNNNYAVGDKFDLNILKSFQYVKEVNETFVPEKQDIKITLNQQVIYNKEDVNKALLKEAEKNKEQYGKWWTDEQAKNKKLETELESLKLDIEKMKKEEA